tara:strand:- start:78 stop:770 length:693 start_codon:yes stop_codon:yes gene_type:complete
MAIRLLPFRQYNETDVINLYKVDPTGTNSMAAPFTNGGNDAGVLVKTVLGNFDSDPVGYVTDSYLGKTDYPFIGRDQYPTVPLTVNEAGSGDAGILGVTLRQTLTYDENGEKLLYYPQKAIEMQAVLTGQAVPVLTRGVITLDGATAFTVEPTAIGDSVFASATEGGKFDGQSHPTHLDGQTPPHLVGSVIASGNRVNRGVAPDYFAGASVGTGAATSAGNYYVIRLNVQ